MDYLKMRPAEIRDAVERNVPLIMAAGSVEYHGPHLPIATDYLIAATIIKRIEERCVCVVAPPLPFAPTMFWAAGSNDGEFDFDPEALRIFAKEILRGFVKIGFRRIYVMQHHQGVDGTPYLAIKLAASEVVREVGKSWGEGWGRVPPEKMPNPNIFSLIRVESIDAFSTYSDGSERIPIGHGSKGETQLMLAGYPETVRMEELDAIKDGLPAWLEDSHLGTTEEGIRWIEFCAAGWVKELADVRLKPGVK